MTTIQGDVVWDHPPEFTDELLLAPDHDTHLTVIGSLINAGGKLTSRPNPGVQHIITIAQNPGDEYKMLGGGCDIYGDAGFWMHGEVDIQGQSKTFKSYLSVGAAAGAVTITLQDQPVGWHPGDILVIAPTAYLDWFEEYRTIQSVAGNVVTLTAPLSRTHPLVVLPNQVVRSAEVINSTYSVRLEGIGPGQRTHMHICDMTAPSTIRFASFQYFGARTGPIVQGPNPSLPILGRYGMHFHLNGDASQGSLVEQVVFRDSGNHVFVPHTSNGVTFRNTAAFNSYEAPVWWDKTERTARLTLDGVVIGQVHNDPDYQGYANTTGFWLQGAEGNVLKDCTVWGVIGNDTSSGMAWPEVTEAAGTPARWDLQGRQTVHNCKFNGVFGWQNNTNPHDIVHYDIYRCGQSAVRLGAYRQQYHTDDIVTQGCGMGLQIYASSGAGRYQQFTNFNEDFGGKSVNGIIVREHGLPFLGPCLVQGSWKGYTGKAVLIKESPAKLQGWYQFRARGNGAELLPADFDIQSIHPSSIIDIIHDDGHSYRYTTPAGWVAA